MNNILIIGTDEQEFAKNAWEHNTNYCIIELTKTELTKEAEEFINNSDVIILSDKSIWSNIDSNYFVEFCNKYDLMPIFMIEENEKCDLFEKICIQLPDAIEYRKNKNNQNLDILMDFTIERLLKGRGSVDDKTV